MWGREKGPGTPRARGHGPLRHARWEGPGVEARWALARWTAARGAGGLRAPRAERGAGGRSVRRGVSPGLAHELRSETASTAAGRTAGRASQARSGRAARRRRVGRSRARRSEVADGEAHRRRRRRMGVTSPGTPAPPPGARRSPRPARAPGPSPATREARVHPSLPARRPPRPGSLPRAPRARALTLRGRRLGLRRCRPRPLRPATRPHALPDAVYAPQAHSPPPLSTTLPPSAPTAPSVLRERLLLASPTFIPHSDPGLGSLTFLNLQFDLLLCPERTALAPRHFPFLALPSDALPGTGFPVTVLSEILRGVQSRLRKPMSSAVSLLRASRHERT